MSGCWQRAAIDSLQYQTGNGVKHLLFVYGSLRPGKARHHLLAGACYLGPHRTESCYTMYDLGEYPGVVERGHHAIVGDIYGVDMATLARVDEYEGYPREYTRRLIATPFGSAWIYLYRGTGAVVIAAGDWCRK